MLLLLAALPALFWDSPPDTAPALHEAGISRILVPRERLAAWKGVAGVTAEAADPGAAVKLQAPTVNYRMQEATATAAPWVIHNGWRILRLPAAASTTTRPASSPRWRPPRPSATAPTL